MEKNENQMKKLGLNLESRAQKMFQATTKITILISKKNNF